MRLPATVLSFGLAAAGLPGAAQGQGIAISRGPTIAASLLRAADGAHETRFLIDARTPGCQTRIRTIPGGIRQVFSCPVDDQRLGKFTLEAELDLLAPGAEGSWDLHARITKLPAALAVASLGVEFELPDAAGKQYVLVPTFSGAEFEEPAATIPATRPLDTTVANSVQATAYYTEGGSGILLFARDPAATKPKHLRYASGRNQQGTPALQLAFEYYVPNPHLGGWPAATPVTTSLLPYAFDPAKESGWFRAAKLYRSWAELHARGPGQILERGRLETRSDVPPWMRELDLFVWELYGWYPEKATVKDPLLHLRRLKSRLGAKSVLVGLWFWSDRKIPFGRFGSWLPLASTVSQIKALLPDDIRFTGYTLPAGFDVLNPLLYDLLLFRFIVTDRAGKPHTTQGIHDGKPMLLVNMDVAEAGVADYFWLLGNYHSQYSGVAGFYFDWPVSVGQLDFARTSGDLGITESAYKGYVNILRAAKAGAAKAGRDFVQYHEAAFEWLISTASAGQGAVGVLGRAYPGETRTRGVPFFQAVYGGYTSFWFADERFGPQILTIEPDTYGDMAKRNMSRVLAEGFTWGSVLNSSEIALGDGKLFFELAAPEPLKGALAHHANTLTNLIALRRLARPWLVYGEMLASPVAGGDLVDMTIKIPFGLQLSKETFRKPAVPATAWRAKDGSIRIVAANGGPSAAAVLLDLTRLGLPGSSGLVDVQTKESFKPDTSGKIRVVVGAAAGRLLQPAQ